MVYKYEASPIVLLIPHGQQSINQSINRTIGLGCNFNLRQQSKWIQISMRSGARF